MMNIESISATLALALDEFLDPTIESLETMIENAFDAPEGTYPMTAMEMVELRDSLRDALLS